jgi:hypothetical protein
MASILAWTEKESADHRAELETDLARIHGWRDRGSPGHRIPRRRWRIEVLLAEETRVSRSPRMAPGRWDAIPGSLPTSP